MGALKNGFLSTYDRLTLAARTLSDDQREYIALRAQAMNITSFNAKPWHENFHDLCKAKDERS